VCAWLVLSKIRSDYCLRIEWLPSEHSGHLNHTILANGFRNFHVSVDCGDRDFVFEKSSEQRVGLKVGQRF
jgi:hypothetical protein